MINKKFNYFLKHEEKIAEKPVVEVVTNEFPTDDKAEVVAKKNVKKPTAEKAKKTAKTSKTKAKATKKDKK